MRASDVPCERRWHGLTQRCPGGKCGTVPVPVDDPGRWVLPGAITNLIAGVPESELGAAVDGYTRFFGRPRDLGAGEKSFRTSMSTPPLFIEPDTVRAGGGRITFMFTGLDAPLEAPGGERWRAGSVSPPPVERFTARAISGLMWTAPGLGLRVMTRRCRRNRSRHCYRRWPGPTAPAGELVP